MMHISSCLLQVPIYLNLISVNVFKQQKKYAWTA